MSIKIIHTADNHIGISYNSVAQAKKYLIEERLNALKRIVEKGNSENADYLVIAGDLFDDTKLNKKNTDEVIKILKGFTKKVLITPGNHDFISSEQDGLWDYFKRKINPEQIFVLDGYEVFADNVGDTKVHFYPAACRTLHSEENMIGWVAEVEKPGDVIHVGIAHGNVVGLGRDEDGKYFNMTEEQLKSAGVDFWLLGHIHVPYPTKEVLQENPGFFMSGTHMPDSWKSTNNGNVWIIEVSNDKKVSARKFQPSSFVYRTFDIVLNSMTDIDTLKNGIQECDKKNSAIRLNVEGILVENEIQVLNTLIEEYQKSDEILYFECNKFINQRIDQTVINKKFSDNSLPHILLSELLQDEPEGLSAQKALEAILNNK